MEEIPRPKVIGDNIAMTTMQVLSSAVLIVCALQTTLDKPFIGGSMAIIAIVTLWHGFATRALDKLACSAYLGAVYVNTLLLRDPKLDQSLAVTPRKVNLSRGFVSCIVSTLCNGALMALLATNVEQTDDIRAYTVHACIAGSIVYCLYLTYWYTAAWQTLASETRRIAGAAHDN